MPGVATAVTKVVIPGDPAEVITDFYWIYTKMD